MTREEAVEVYNGLINEKIKAAFEFFAPELRESGDKTNDPGKAKDIAWLEKQKELPLTDEAFKEQLERVLRDNVLDTDIRITGDTVIGAKINPEDKGLFLRSLSDEAILKECKERGLDVKYSGEENLAYRLNWVMQDYYKAGKDEEEREHRLKCYKLFWDALADETFFEHKEQKPVDDPLDDPKFIKGFDTGREVQRIFDEQKPAEWSEEDEENFKWFDKFFRAESVIAGGRDIPQDKYSWFKSLRPSWKPSEEQMDRLFSIIAALRKDYCDDMADFLANLRTDLKKLGVKEEPEYYQHFDPDC